MGWIGLVVWVSASFHVFCGPLCHYVAVCYVAIAVACCLLTPLWNLSLSCSMLGFCSCLLCEGKVVHACNIICVHCSLLAI